MEEKITNLRLKFDGFMKNKESALIVRKEAYLVLDEAHQMGRNDIADEIEDMLIDLESSLGENKCNCSRNCKCQPVKERLNFNPSHSLNEECFPYSDVWV